MSKRNLHFILDLDVPVVTSSTSTPKEGDELTLTCNAVTTDVIMQYAWYHYYDNDHDHEVIGQTNKTFNVIGGDKMESGNYTCRVKTQRFEKLSAGHPITYLCTCFHIQ